MAKQNQSEPSLNVDRRHLLVAVAAVAAGIVPNAQGAGATNAAGLNAGELPVSESPPWSVCAATARRIEEIAARNRIRKEAGLPLLSVPRELRKIRNAEVEAEFERFSGQHRQAVWDEVLAATREARREPNWRPNGLMEGLAYQLRVSRILRERFESIRPKNW
jgi:hypothetical protein